MTLVIGVDPGPTTGIATVRPGRESAVIQANPIVVPELVLALSHRATYPMILAVEKFVIGRASMRAGRHGVVTREVIGALQSLCRTDETDPHGFFPRLVLRSASEVKPWATDERLAAAGLIAPTKGMTHARDAARHAIFAAVHAGLMPDPFSRKAG